MDAVSQTVKDVALSLAFALPILGVAGKLYLDYWLKRRHESAIADLKAEQNLQLERLRADLRIEEHRFSHLHKERSEVLKNIYIYLIDMETGLKQQVSRLEKGDSEEQLSTNWANVHKEFQDYFSKNRLLLDLDGRAVESQIRWSAHRPIKMRRALVGSY